MVVNNLEGLEEKIRKNISEAGKRILLVSPITQRRRTIYESASFLAFSTLSTVVSRWTDWEIETFDSYRFPDEGKQREELEREIQRFNPAIVGVTSTSPEHPDAIDTARYVLNSCDRVIIKGGVHERDCYKTTLENHPEIDISFVGEADFSLPEFLNRAGRGETIAGLEGISYRNGNGIVTVNKKFLTEAELNQVPLPDTRFFEANLNWDLFGGKKVARVMSQRGCSYRCDFCASSFAMRGYNIGMLIDYLKELHGAGFEAVFFEDSTFTLDRPRTVALVSGLENLMDQGIRFEYAAQTRFDRLDGELIRLLAKTGFSYIYAGTESYSDEVLRRINKGLTVEKIEWMTRALKQSGIRVGVPIARGFPGDNENLFLYSLGKVLELEPEYVFIEGAKIYPGTNWSRDYGEKEVSRLYDKGIWTPKNVSPEDAGTLLIVDSVKLAAAYETARRVLSAKYDPLNISFYHLRK